MNDVGLIIIEVVSSALAFILVRSMIKPYRMMGEARYLGLPLGFTFLGISCLFTSASLHFRDPMIVEKLQWLRIFTGAYAFILLALTYYFSSRIHERRKDLSVQVLVSLIFLVLIVAFITVFALRAFALPNYKTVDEHFRIPNMILALYVTLFTLRRHSRKPDPKTILAPLGYALLAFSQYSFLVWSLDSTFSALVGAYIIQVVSLLIFLFISYETYFRGKVEVISHILSQTLMSFSDQSAIP